MYGQSLVIVIVIVIVLNCIYTSLVTECFIPSTYSYTLTSYKRERLGSNKVLHFWLRPKTKLTDTKDYIHPFIFISLFQLIHAPVWWTLLTYGSLYTQVGQVTYSKIVQQNKCHHDTHNRMYTNPQYDKSPSGIFVNLGYIKYI